MNKPFWYLASPYSKHPLGPEIAYRNVCQKAAEAFKAGLLVFSPIAHTHSIATYGELELGFEFWSSFDHAMLSAAVGMIILTDDGWQESAGIRAEIQICKTQGKRICHWYMDESIGQVMELYGLD